jgi:DNA adenine methylase
MPTKTVLKYHGGKAYLAGKFWDIVKATSWEPIHVVEPYCGGASFTIEGLVRGLPYSFVINDIDRTLTNFWRVLQGQTSFRQFARLAEAVPFSEAEFKESMANSILAADGYGHSVHEAAAFFIRNRMSLAGRMKGFTGVTKTRVRRGMNNEVSAWLGAVEGLEAFHSLLKKALILDSRPALEVIKAHDGPKTLFYLDPPYLHETRATTGEYANEMTREQHMELLQALFKVRGRFMLSGYRSEMYDKIAETGGWTRHDFGIANHAAGGKTKRKMVESLWVNF